MATLKELGVDYTKRDALIVETTPALVDALIALNTHNRSLKVTQVKRIAKDINDGNYVFTNQGIGVTKSGFLTDGQHRLYAMRECGYPKCLMLLVTGLDDNAQAVVDRHSKRGQADIVSLLMNQTVTTKMVATINAASRMRQTSEKFSLVSTRESIVSEFDMANIIVESGEEITAIISAAGEAPSSLYAALWHYGQRTSISQATDLAVKIKTGAGLAEDDPAYRLRETLIKRKAIFNSGSQGKVELYSVAVSACKAHSMKKPLKLLRSVGNWDGLKTWE